MEPSNLVEEQQKSLVISIDAMGGDKGPTVIIDGIVKSLLKHPDTFFIIHGNKEPSLEEWKESVEFLRYSINQSLN